MKSIKPERGPSGLGFLSAVIAIIFGMIYIIIGFTFPFFGIIFITVGIVQAVYYFHNLKDKNRFSIVDIVDSKEEGDSTDRWISNEAVMGDDKPLKKTKTHDYSYCPYCKHKLDNDDKFCPNCGKELA